MVPTGAWVQPGSSRTHAVDHGRDVSAPTDSPTSMARCVPRHEPPADPELPPAACDLPVVEGVNRRQLDHPPRGPTGCS